MRKSRFVISDHAWSLIESLLPGTSRSRGVTAKDNRLFLEAVLWRVRVRRACREFSLWFCEWNSVLLRPRRRAPSGGFDRLFLAAAGPPRFDYSLIYRPLLHGPPKASRA